MAVDDRRKLPEIVGPRGSWEPQGSRTPSEGALRARVGSRFFTDESLDRYTHLLDDQFHIPGVPFRFGIDGLIGLIPGLGDIAGGLLSCVTLIAAWARGVPYVTLARMLVNVGIEVILGSVPLLGDIFDIAWKANRRNYALLTRHVAEPRHHTWRDWVFLGCFGVLFLVILLVPFFLLMWVVSLLAHAR